MLFSPQTLARRSWRIVSGNSAEVQQYFDRLLVLPSAPRQANYSTFINSLVSAGVWAKLDALWELECHDSSASLVNLISSSFALTLGNVPTFTVDVGWTCGAGSSYLATNFNPSTAGGHFVRDDAVFGMETPTNAGGGSAFQVLLTESTPAANGNELTSHWSDGNSYWMVNGASEITVTAPADTSGFWLAQRTASNASAIYHDDTTTALSTSATTSVALPNKTFNVFNSPASGCVGRSAWIGASLDSTQRAALKSALAAYRAGL